MPAPRSSLHVGQVYDNDDIDDETNTMQQQQQQQQQAYHQPPRYGGGNSILSNDTANPSHPHFHPPTYLPPPGQIIDEDLRLRIVRTPTESLHEAIREDERRRIGKRKRKPTLRNTLFGAGSKLSRGLSIGGSIKSSSQPTTTQHNEVPLPNNRPGTSGSSNSTSAIAEGIGMGLQGFGGALTQQLQSAHLQPQPSPSSSSPPASANTRTADEEQEAKAEQFAAPSGDNDQQQGSHLGTSGNNDKLSSHTRQKSKSGGGSGFGSLLGLASSKNKIAAESRRRRNVYLNLDLPMSELDKYGLPRLFSRNKVRTSKYTIWTFLPKNLAEQFRRVANLYFLGLIVLQIFPIFGGASPVVAMLPLLAILILTGIKDGIEDYRRQQLDDSVNNSAVTRLGDWRNVNVAQFRPSFFSRIFGASSSSSSSSKSQPQRKARSPKVSKGVRKLREKEGALNTDFLYVGGSQSSELELGYSSQSNASMPNFGGESANALDGNNNNGSGRGSGINYRDDSLEIIDSYGSDKDGNNGGDGAATSLPMSSRGRSDSLARSMATGATSAYGHGMLPKNGVVDYDRQSPGTAKWERTLWKKLEVGDIVLLRDNDQVPADIVVLSTSDADGQCFVETKNLDGETNLKPRRALKATMSIQHEEDVEHAQFVIDSEPPNANLYSYNGVLKYWQKEQAPGQEHPIIEGAKQRPRIEQKDAITINELLLRGCAIRNTTWIIGIVAYTGADSKIMLNQGETPSKRSKIDKETNFNVLANFVILLAMCIACGVANGIYLAESSTSARSYEKGVNPSSSNVLNAIVTFGACLIVFQNIVPVSLVITVELVRTMQAIFIWQDIDMWYEPLDHPCVPKTWNISDDLGQIEYIFSDKTGTLTQNVMEFKKCSINGVSYGEGVTEAMLGAAKRDGKDISETDLAADEASIEKSKFDMISMMKHMFKNRYLREDKLTFISPRVIEDLEDRSTSQRQNIIQFFRALAICHTVLGDRFDPENQNLIEYKAESPDEAALVAAARDCGFVFLQRSNAEIEIEVMGQPERHQPLRVLEFNSTRKRMSVIVRQPDGRILMICKGADTVIYQRLAKDHDQNLEQATERDMEEFANSGLRTLCIAYRYLPEEEFVQWAALYDAACAAVNDREDEIEKACELVEKDLIIMGATALEDKLQVGVPDAIAQLHKAGIKLWILTGDKVQTAIEIGYSCNLLTNNMDIMIISSDTDIGARAQIEAGLDKITKARLNPSERPADGFAVVIDGETLRHALDPSLKPLFLELTTQCSAVVCCRVSPSQKALTVKLVKDGKNAMTLAIGDGANDVAMIQEAHIGIGIAGLEGAQASMSADYAIGQFRYLTKLLLVHGRWCYIRVAEMHANFFYKNIVWVIAMFWYQFFCNYLFDYPLLLLYNLAFTSLPVMIMGAFDQDLDAKTSMLYPQLYMRGIKGLEYSRTVFWTYMLDGLYQSAIVFFIPYLVYNWSGTATSRGFGQEAIVEMGTTIAASAVITVTLFVAMNNTYHTALMIAILFVSALLFYIWVAIYSAFPFAFNYLVVILFSTVDFWALLVIIQVIAIGPRFVYKYIQSNYAPIDNDIIREHANLERKRKGKGHLDAEDGSAFTSRPEKSRDATSTPNLDVKISQTPLPFERPGHSNEPRQHLEMAQLQDRRASIPLDTHRFPPTNQDTAAHYAGHSQPYDSSVSPPPPPTTAESEMGRRYMHSAIPVGPNQPRRMAYQVHEPTRSDAYEEIALRSQTPSTATSPQQQFLQVGRDRQDSNTPLTPHMYDGTYGSPPLSPLSGHGHQRMQTGSTSLTREGSVASYTTAVSGGYMDHHPRDFNGYAQ